MDALETTERQPVMLIVVMATAMTVAILLQVVFGALAPFLRDDLGLSRTQLGSLTTAMYVSAAALSTGEPCKIRTGIHYQKMLLLCGLLPVHVLVVDLLGGSIAQSRVDTTRVTVQV